MVEYEELLTPAEVAKIFRVHAKTVTRWAQEGRLNATWTLGGHRRYKRTEVMALLRESEQPREGDHELKVWTTP